MRYKITGSPGKIIVKERSGLMQIWWHVYECDALHQAVKWIREQHDKEVQAAVDKWIAETP